MTKPNPERVWKFFEFPEDPNGCWIWKGSSTWSGYSKFMFNHIQYRGHRFMYEYLLGEIPKGLTLDHLCRNIACVNPDHLEPVTLIENLNRGFGIGKINKEKTHCNSGHEFTKENTYYFNGWRNCKKCHNKSETEYRKRKNEKLLVVTNDTAVKVKPK